MGLVMQNRQLFLSWILGLVDTITCAHDRRVLQQLALNVHVKIKWPDQK